MVALNLGPCPVVGASSIGGFFHALGSRSPPWAAAGVANERLSKTFVLQVSDANVVGAGGASATEAATTVARAAVTAVSSAKRATDRLIKVSPLLVDPERRADSSATSKRFQYQARVPTANGGRYPHRDARARRDVRDLARVT